MKHARGKYVNIHVSFFQIVQLLYLFIKPFLRCVWPSIFDWGRFAESYAQARDSKIAYLLYHVMRH